MVLCMIDITVNGSDLKKSSKLLVFNVFLEYIQLKRIWNSVWFWRHLQLLVRFELVDHLFFSHGRFVANNLNLVNEILANSGKYFLVI